MVLELSELNLILVDFQDCHKRYEYDLSDKLFDLNITGDISHNSDAIRIIYHYTIKGVIDYINSVNSNNKIVIYFNKTQFYDSIIFNQVDYDSYMQIIINLFNKIKSILPIKVVVSCKSLAFLQELVSKDDGRAMSTIIKIYHTVSTFKVENFTFEKMKKFASKYDLTFLHSTFFNNVQNQQIIFK